MTQKEKARAYDEAIERAREWYNEEEPDSYTCIVESIFPELKESGDERIRGAIIDHLKDCNLTEWAAWLEKQVNKSQSKIALKSIKEEKVDNQNCVKFADKVEPKFKDGDWAVSDLDKKARQISEVHFDEYNSYLCG